MDVTSTDSAGGYAVASMDCAENLIARVRRGDAEAFRLIFEQHHRLVLRFIYGMTGERALAEELTQETFMQAYKGIHALREEAKLSAWLCGIARNLVRRWLRSSRRESSRVELDQPYITELQDSGRPDDQLINKELRRTIHHALQRLDEDKRLVFTLKVLQQRNYEEIAQITGYSIAKLKTDLHRAKAEMRQMIRPILEMSHEV